MRIVLAGPLMGAKLLRMLTGLDPDLSPVTLTGYCLTQRAGAPLPALARAASAHVDAMLWVDPAGDGLARLDYYMRVHGQARQATSNGDQVYIANGEPAPGATWDAAGWQARWADLMPIAAAEVMRHYPERPALQTAARVPSILAAAASRVMARKSGPTTLRRRASAEDVQVLDQEQPYAGFFSIEEYTLQHRRFDGSLSAPIRRTAFLSTDVVTVLPYDPVRDRVLLVEQFRMGPFARGDTQCWSLEAIAGRCEPAEPPETTARREAQEEAGLTLTRLIKVGGYYPTPGAKTEYVHAYLGLADLPDDSTGIAGLEAEGEDIRSHLLPFADLAGLIQSGEIENAPLILSVHWLSQQRESLSASA